MLLRSSSTPVLGSLLTSFSESPNSNHYTSELHGSTPKHTPPPIHQNCTKLSCTNNGGSHSIGKSFLSSPSVAEANGTTSLTGFRRVQSEGNLEELTNALYGVDEFSFSKKFPRRQNCCTLEAIPSFSPYTIGSSFDYESDEDELEQEEIEGCFRVENLVSEKERVEGNDYCSLNFEGVGKMYLASGLGVSGIEFVTGGGEGGCGGGGGNCRPVDFDQDGGESQGLGIEQHYKKMLEGSPGNSLLLRNYAQFLYQKKGDLEGAEEYYSRAILADPEDGEILSQYAKLIWELHHDKERATNYFERAIHASSENSHVHAAYASFLWDIEDDDEEEDIENEAGNSGVGRTFLHHEIIASATA